MSGSAAETVVARALEQLVSAGASSADVLLVEAEADEALAAVLTAMELSPGNADLSHQLGRVHEARFLKVQLTEEREEWSILEEALVALDKAIELYAETPRGQKHSWYGLEAQLEKAKVLALWPDRRLETADAYRGAIDRAGGCPRTQKVIRRALAYARRRDRSGSAASGSNDLERSRSSRLSPTAPRVDERRLRLPCRAARSARATASVLRALSMSMGSLSSSPGPQRKSI